MEGETCRVQLLNGPTSFRSTSIKPYFRSKTSETARDVDLDELEAPSPTPEVSQESIEPVEPTTKRGRGRPRKHPVTENPVTENHLTSADIPVKQLPSADISVLI